MIDVLSPLDGRYERKVLELKKIFSEYGLIKNRIIVEISWLKALCNEEGVSQCRNLTNDEKKFLDKIIKGFSLEEAQKVKDIEKTTNHDVKAVEYYLKDKFEGTKLEQISEFIHFACTSEDINNISHALMLREGITF